MSDKDFQAQAEEKDQEKNKLTRFMEGLDDFYNGYSKENSEEQMLNLLNSIALFIKGEE